MSRPSDSMVRAAAAWLRRLTAELRAARQDLIDAGLLLEDADRRLSTAIRQAPVWADRLDPDSQVDEDAPTRPRLPRP